MYGCLDTYETAVAELGLGASGSVAVIPQSVRALSASGSAIDPETFRFRAPWLALTTLRSEHLKASMALSRHLSTHRC